MKKLKYISILAGVVIILPYLGFPYYIKNMLFVLSGLAILYFSFKLYKDLKTVEEETVEVEFDNFSENGDFTEEKSE